MTTDAPDTVGIGVARALDSETRRAVGFLWRSPLFWAGLVAKLAASALFGSHFATRWFAPFVHGFVTHPFADPWARFLARGEPLAFPYGPGMLGALSIAWLPALAVPIDPAGHAGLVLLRLPLLVADLAVLALLMRWLRVHVEDALRVWWLNPIVFYATYVHGQLDLIPTALLCAALYHLFSRRVLAAAVLFGAALATKGHVLLCLPFALLFLRRHRLPWARFALVALGVGAAPYLALLPSHAFREMVLESAETRRLWSVAIPYGSDGVVLYASVAALALILLRFAAFRRVNRELTLAFIGGTYLLLVALTPPQPGWFLWSLPFVAHVAARRTRAGRNALLTLSALYVSYFLVARPQVFLEALDPTLGRGAGEALFNKIAATAPGLFSPHAASLVWSGLFASTLAMGFEMYRAGVRGNASYRFLDTNFMLGVGGDSGAGKHTLADDLRAVLGAQLLVVHGDDDHRWERGHTMWRKHTHLDPRANRLIEQVEALAMLRSDAEVRKRSYDHARGRFTEPERVAPRPFVAVVGLHPFYLQQQRALLHLKVFVDTDETLRRQWKVARDVRERGHTEDQVVAEIERRAADSARYVRPQRLHGDVIVRHLPDASDDARAFAVDVELASALEPLYLLEVLAQLPNVTVEWAPDKALTRDTFALRGSVEASALRGLAASAIPDIEDLVEHEGWRDGGRGMVQFVLLHAISARLRAPAAPGGAER